MADFRALILQRHRQLKWKAFDWLEAEGESQLVLRLTGALWRFWVMRGHPAEGRRRLESALRADELPTEARASALDGAAVVATDLGGDPAAGKHWAEEALGLHRVLGEPWGIAHSSFLLGASANEEGDFMRGLMFLEEAVRTFRDLVEFVSTKVDDDGEREFWAGRAIGPGPARTEGTGRP